MGWEIKTSIGENSCHKLTRSQPAAGASDAKSSGHGFKKLTPTRIRSIRLSAANPEEVFRDYLFVSVHESSLRFFLETNFSNTNKHSI